VLLMYLHASRCVEFTYNLMSSRVVSSL
jgi:hypothetical protein